MFTDADIELAELQAMGNAIARAQRAGRCTHGSVVGYRPVAVYPEQDGLRPGQLRCTAGCRRVFDSDDAWYNAMDDAING